MTHHENVVGNSATTWRKSSFSAINDCVDVHGTLGALRDTKNAAGPRLTGPVSQMVAAIKAGTLTR